VTVGALTLQTGGVISSSTIGNGDAGRIIADVQGNLLIDGSRCMDCFTGIASDSGRGTGNAGSISLTAGAASIINTGEIETNTLGSGSGGNITLQAGALGLMNGGQISSSTGGGKNGGNVVVSIAGDLTIDGSSAQSPVTGLSAIAAQHSQGD